MMELQTIPLAGAARLKAYLPDPEIGHQVTRKRPGIILAPGGAYLIHATGEKEGVALEFLAKGYQVFILEYSLGLSSWEAKERGAQALDTDARYPLPVLEMMEAIHYVRTHAEALCLDDSRLFLMGFSAGAHVCASCGVFWNAPEFTGQLSFIPRGQELRVSGMVLCYPMLNPSPEGRPASASGDGKLIREFLYQTQTPNQEQKDAVNVLKHVSPATLPAFVWHSVNDPVVPSVETTRFVLELQQNGVSCEYHLFEKGRHAMGLANEVYARTPEDAQPDIAVWTDLAHRWMKRQK